jgi:hypothetical protein
MKLISLLTIGLAVTPLAPAQQPVKPASATSGSAKLSDQEKNIRAYIELMRSDVRQQKTEIAGIVMQLDAEESAKFWPVYKDFEKELANLYDNVVGMVKDYTAKYENMTNQVADDLANRALDFEKQRNELKRTYYKRFKDALDPVVAARFLQVENQIERLIDLQISSELPVVDRSRQ